MKTRPSFTLFCAAIFILWWASWPKRAPLGRQQAIKKLCGALCAPVLSRLRAPANMTVAALRARQIKTNVPPNLFTKEAELLLDASFWPPPRDIPAEFMADYTLHGRIGVSKMYKAKRYLEKTAQVPDWGYFMLQGLIEQALNRTLVGAYGLAQTHALYDTLLKANLTDATVLVIGSESPWVEALCLAADARHVTTLEYGRIHSRFPWISTVTPSEFAQLVRDQALEPFDVVVSYSSVEHSGLGRYGDALNPWGDVLAMARAWTVLKPHGTLILGVPGCPNGIDRLFFNVHRIYGFERLPILLQNFQVQTLWTSPEHTCVLKGKPSHRGEVQNMIVVAKKM